MYSVNAAKKAAPFPEQPFSISAVLLLLHYLFKQVFHIHLFADNSAQG